MKRTTLLLPDELAVLLEMEAKRSGHSTARVVREALASYLRGGVARPNRLAFASLGRSGTHDTAQRAEEIIEREWHDRGR